MLLNRALLLPVIEDAARSDRDRYLTARGLYNSIQFVLKLSPEIHRLLADLPSGIYSSRQLSFEQVQAFSTYLHETIHWWQHVGSTAGLLSSLSYLTQTHANFTHLKRFINEIGPKKSILQFTSTSTQKGAHFTNIIINNYMDIEFYKVLTVNPQRARSVCSSPYFESMGHSFEIFYSNVLALLSHALDKDWSFLPDARTWRAEFQKLNSAREDGFFYGSQLALAPIGLHEIFEGQARFCQLQYLYFASGNTLTWEDARSQGMLGEIYVKAFEYFLSMANCVLACANR